MNWARLPADGRVTALPPSKAELDNLRSIVTRSLKDVTAVGLSADYRFVMAYDAARTLSLPVVRAAEPAFAKLSAYFDGCRMKRNQCEYDSPILLSKRLCWSYSGTWRIQNNGVVVVTVMPEQADQGVGRRTRASAPPG